MPAQSITVIGAGLTGLASAFHLSRRFPSALITVLEKSHRAGGWVGSDRVSVNGAEIVLEAGPRTLRPLANSVLEMINLLGLKDSIISVPKKSPAAQNRFLHIPGTRGLTALPNSIGTLITSPVPMLSAILQEILRRPNRPKNITDESVDSFLSRRFNPEFARIFGSALIHGIYAADSRLLSVRSAMPSLWNAEENGWGGIARGFVRGSIMPSPSVKTDYEVGTVPGRMKGVSVFSFRDGMETLTSSMTKSLQQNCNVNIEYDVDISSITPSHDNITLSTSLGEIRTGRVVSTIPCYALDPLISAPLPHLTANSYSSVTVVNLIFPGSNLHLAGFGYLVSRPPSGYSEDILGVLGTVFDSCSLSSQDRSADKYVKMTVMIGGPHKGSKDNITIGNVVREISSQMNIVLPKPLYTRIRYHSRCIPIYAPGHLDRMVELENATKKSPWDGRLAVIGAGVGGVSVGDCIESGKRVGERWYNK